MQDGVPSRPNRVLLLLNLCLVVTNAILVLGTTAGTDSPARVAPPRSATDGTAIPVARALQAAADLGRPDDVFAPEPLRAVRDAARRYVEIVVRGVDDLQLAAEGTDLAATFAEIQRAARQEVEIVLGARIRDPVLVQRLATEIIRACR